jgi:two-component system nitrogen regulation response regulator GlnG
MNEAPPTDLRLPPLVLLAEDDDEMRLLMTRALGRDGYDVVAARDGSSAATLLVAARDQGRMPAVLVADICMPGKSGLELADWIMREARSIEVVLVSAFVDERTLRTARALGVACVISKPFDLDDLRTIVIHILPRRAMKGQDAPGA